MGEKNPSDKMVRRWTVAFSRIVLFAFSLPLMVVFLPTLVFLFFGMLPSLVALISVRNRYRYSWLCIGGLNLAGALPVLFEMWFGSHTIEAAFSHLMDVNTILIVYGAATVGWLVYMGVPPIVQSLVLMSNSRRIAQLRASQNRLLKEWGDQIAEGREPPPAGG